MPVGISFENSSLKNSFSLSSLQQTVSETTPEKCVVRARQFNSLTKNRVKATAVRRSWGSTASDQREEFWSVLQANYNYIMDNQLIDKCQEVDGDLSKKSESDIWTLKEFYSHFSELYSWLNSVQETIYSKEKNITDKALRAHCVNKVLDKTPLLKSFNDQASQLVQMYPEVQEEVSWRKTHLNSKWDSILSIIGPTDCDMCDQDSCLDIDHELKCLRNWFKIMESCLQPLDFKTKYSKTEIETKGLEIILLHRDIENHGKIVSSVVKLCKRPDAKCNTTNARRIANGLERRWHLLFLRSLEWQCYLESLSKRQNIKGLTSSSEESDSDCYREPASKYPRLSRRHLETDTQVAECYSGEDDELQIPLTNDSVMSDPNFDIRNEIDELDGTKHPSCADTSKFTQSNKKAPNLATYYFKHEDTDTQESDMERFEERFNGFHGQRIREGNSILGETSEEEWTYLNTMDVEQTETTIDVDENSRKDHFLTKPKAISGDTIRMLVQRADELVSPDKCRKTERSNSLKMSRVNRWLCKERSERPDDSCDASGEDDEKESQTSAELDTSSMTLRDEIGLKSQNTSNSELRTESPWCASCTSQLTLSGHISGINNFSISESALHKMNLSPKFLDRFTVSTNSFINSNNSTSSTVEEVSGNGWILEKSSPIRRKKSKLKKKQMFGKSETHVLPSPGGTGHHRSVLIKSGSFSGYSLNKAVTERHSTSDPSEVHKFLTYNQYPLISCDASTTSGADSEEDTRPTHYKNVVRQRHLHLNEIRDDSPGKSSLNATESSSLSEAWDNYQENYLSEPYSESHDSDAARKLLNFGEDYRSFIDSQSDWSAFSDMSPKFKRKGIAKVQNVADSNSDEESLKQLINDSRDQLKYAQEIFDHVKGDSLINTSEIDNLVSNCDRHIALLNHITESSDEYKMTAGDKAITTGLLSQWQSVKFRSLKMQEYRRLQKELDDLKMFVTCLELPNDHNRKFSKHPMEDFNIEMEACKRILELIKSQSVKLASFNAMAHRFTLENQDFDDYSKCTLKSDISELYEFFEQARARASNKLSEIENLLPAWKMLETRLDQLQKDLMEDEKTINLLDSVLSNGQFTNQTATCVRDVAKVLSESNSYQGYPIPELFHESSFSDSGISDEGSEHDIGERQGRLAAIRRLVRQLEVGLPPDSKARVMMREKLNAAEQELKALQLKCRHLIVKTAACSNPVLEKLSEKNKEKQPGKSTIPDGDDDDPGNDPDPRNSSWFKRLFKASLAFQIVILTFVCLSCMYEPQCCDYMNNYSWSMSPKLTYQGKPPI